MRRTVYSKSSTDANEILSDPRLSAAERAGATGDLSRASKTLDLAEKYIPRT
ncbi:MAG: hypothetical protein QOI21_412 [Actinomycetota bacterium]|jgi:hypothetical protein|nr:hypothetical protein [Actinomycetota bacterium]